MGLMYLEAPDAYRGTALDAALGSGRRLRLDEVIDGTTTTVLASENINSGVGAQWEQPGFPSNWACPHPWNTSFVVNGYRQAVNTMQDNDGRVGFGYNYNLANVRGRQAPPLVDGGEGGLKGDLSGTLEGVFPYPNSGHPGGVHLLMCDGSARFLSEGVAGVIWARLVTPLGARILRPFDGMMNQAAQEDALQQGMGFTQNALPEEF
jgi:prepilin-type processing-associated H-X9-DG protein